MWSGQALIAHSCRQCVLLAVSKYDEDDGTQPAASNAAINALWHGHASDAAAPRGSARKQAVSADVPLAMASFCIGVHLPGASGADVVVVAAAEVEFDAVVVDCAAASEKIAKRSTTKSVIVLQRQQGSRDD